MDLYDFSSIDQGLDTRVLGGAGAAFVSSLKTKF